MFGMGFTELIIIAVIAIIFLGPDKLPDALMNIVKTFRSIKETIDNAKDTLEQEINIKELKEEASAYKEDLMTASDKLKSATTLNLDAAFGDTLEDLKEIEQGMKQEIEKIDTKVMQSTEVMKEEIEEVKEEKQQEVVMFKKKKKKV